MMSAAVLNNRISISKRLFVTATPRVLRPRATKSDGEPQDARFFSMDNTKLYGRCGVARRAELLAAYARLIPFWSRLAAS